MAMGEANNNKTQNLHDWLQIVGIAAVVASLVFVGLQLKQADEVAYAELSEVSAARGVEQSALIAEHADIWQKACLGEELTAAESVIAGNIYFRYAQGNFNNWARKRETGIGITDSSFFIDAYAANVHRYVGFREMALSWNEWSEEGARIDADLADEYRAAVFQRLSELQLEEPNPTADVMWCGVR